MLLKVWYAKSNVRRLYLALKEEKRPLEQVTQSGMATKLGKPDKSSDSRASFCTSILGIDAFCLTGTKGKEKVMAALQKRGARLRPALDTYNRLLNIFTAACPNRLMPRNISYKELMEAAPDDPFWNEGVFTYADQLWATDRRTQIGMRAHARQQRGEEEVRRLGWEIRRSMRWAVREVKELISLLKVYNPTSTPPDFPPKFVSLVQHQSLAALTVSEKLLAVKNLLHAQFLHVSQLQLTWHADMMRPFSLSPSQEGDWELQKDWNWQINLFRYLRREVFLTQISNESDSLHEGLQTFSSITLSLPHNHKIEPEIDVALVDEADETQEAALEEGIEMDAIALALSDIL